MSRIHKSLHLGPLIQIMSCHPSCRLLLQKEPSFSLRRGLCTIHHQVHRLANGRGHIFPHEMTVTFVRKMEWTSGTCSLTIRFISTDSSFPRKAAKGRIAITWQSVGITAILAGILWAGMMHAKKQKEEEIAKNRQKQIGKAKIGGEWELTDHNGVPRTSKEYLGTWLLIYFGFTHCPDICPDEIEKMMKTLELLEKRHTGANFQPLFITVDPARDSVEAVKRYVADFSPRLLGLTGTQEQVTKTAKAFRVYFSAAPADVDDDYIVDHTIIIYLIGPDGKFVDYYGQNKTAEQMADHIEIQINRFKYLNI